MIFKKSKTFLFENSIIIRLKAKKADHVQTSCSKTQVTFMTHINVLARQINLRVTYINIDGTNYCIYMYEYIDIHKFDTIKLVLCNKGWYQWFIILYCLFYIDDLIKTSKYS